MWPFIFIARAACWRRRVWAFVLRGIVFCHFPALLFRAEMRQQPSRPANRLFFLRHPHPQVALNPSPKGFRRRRSSRRFPFHYQRQPQVFQRHLRGYSWRRRGAFRPPQCWWLTHPQKGLPTLLQPLGGRARRGRVRPASPPRPAPAAFFPTAFQPSHNRGTP